METTTTETGTYEVEHTDTFGGEANYCWVNRYRITPKGKTRRGERLSLVRQAKALTGLTGVRCEVSDMGDVVKIRPRGLCQVVFVSWVDE